MQPISLRLREIRRERNLSQEELARQLGISRQAIIALEQGASLPSLPVIMALLRVLDIPFQQLLTDSWSPFRVFDTQTPASDASSLATYRHSEGSLQIPVQVTEDEGTIYVIAELAGVKDEDVTVDMSPQHVLIMAIKRPVTANETNMHIQEILYGPLMRILSLPCPINTTDAQAEFNRGQLYLKLPKLMPEAKRRITFKNNNTEIAPKEEHGSK
jgi:HSP20 family molecular chaperone IbpA